MKLSNFLSVLALVCTIGAWSSAAQAAAVCGTRVSNISDTGGMSFKEVNREMTRAGAKCKPCQDKHNDYLVCSSGTDAWAYSAPGTHRPIHRGGLAECRISVESEDFYVWKGGGIAKHFSRFNNHAAQDAAAYLDQLVHLGLCSKQVQHNAEAEPADGADAVPAAL